MPTPSKRNTGTIEWAKSLPRRKGQADFIHQLEGKRLTPRKRINAMCYSCSAGYDLGEYCKVSDCPLFPLNPYHQMKKHPDLSRVGDVCE